MILRKSEQFEATRSIARSLCDIWASAFIINCVAYCVLWLSSVGDSDGGGSHRWRVRVLSVGKLHRGVSSRQRGPANSVSLLWTLYTRRSLHRLQLRTHGLRSWRHGRRRRQMLRQAALHVSCDVTARGQHWQQRRVPPGPHSAPARQVYLPERWGNWISRLLIRCRWRIVFGARVAAQLPIPLSLALNGFLTASYYATPLS